jgi:hypothetical protein
MWCVEGVESVCVDLRSVLTGTIAPTTRWDLLAFTRDAWFGARKGMGVFASTWGMPQIDQNSLPKTGIARLLLREMLWSFQRWRWERYGMAGD